LNSSESPKISVIIPFHNSERTLKLCLDSLCKQIHKPDEIILVDNNSKDTSKEIVESFASDLKESKIQYVFEKKLGPSAARNRGAKLATGDWFLFSDSDCVPTSRWTLDYIRHFGDESIGAVAGRIKPYPPDNLVQKIQSLFTLPQNENEIIHDNTTLTEGFYPTANLAVRKELFALVGGFNEALRYGEDHELCYKIYDADYKIKAVKDAVVEHIHRKNMNAFLKQSFRFGTSHPYELRNLSGGRIIFMSPFLKINKAKPGIFIWIDLNQADKKFLALIILGVIWWPLFALCFAYSIYLCIFISKRLRYKKITGSIWELPLLLLLLSVKSLSLTAGRISHGFKHRVLCF
jgi:glycosyltransferase involved in cell wall biosynthesis